MTPGERETYRLHRRLPACRRRLAAAREIIAVHPGYAVSVSWGKDSVAMLALAAEVRERVIAINARYPNPNERFADMDRVRDAALSMFDNVDYREFDCPGEWEMYERAGHGFVEARSPAEREAARWWKRELDRRSAEALSDLGCSGVMFGLRQDESNARRLNAVTHGVSYRRKDGLRIALPMSRLTGRDIWALLVDRDLPWLRIYDSAESGRERARSGFVWATGAADAAARHGVMQDWRRAYPAEYHAWVKRWPELAAGG